MYHEQWKNLNYLLFVAILIMFNIEDFCSFNKKIYLNWTKYLFDKKIPISKKYL